MPQEVMNDTEKAITELIEILSPLSQEEINTVPFAGSWTAAQVGQHLLKSYAVINTINGRVEQTGRPPDQKNAAIRSVFLNFDMKMKSPEFIMPSPDPIDKTTLINKLEEKKQQLSEAIENLDLSVTCVSYSLPQFGEFTRLEWICFVTCHTQRHVHQLKNIVEKIRAAA